MSHYYSTAIELKDSIREGIYCNWNNVNCASIDFTFRIRDPTLELAFIVDGFPQDGQHLMDIYATTAPPGTAEGDPYWLAYEWHFLDVAQSQDREILVIPGGSACKRINFAEEDCILFISLNVTGSDVYNVELTTNYTPESCQVEKACAGLDWSGEKKRCCLYDAWEEGGEVLGGTCRADLEAQAAANPKSILGEESSCFIRRGAAALAPENPGGASAGVVALLVVTALLLLSACAYVVRVSEKRRELVKKGFLNVGSNNPLHSGVPEDLKESLLYKDAKMDSHLGGMVPSQMRVGVGTRTMPVQGIVSDFEISESGTERESDIEMK